MAAVLVCTVLFGTVPAFAANPNPMAITRARDLMSNTLTVRRETQNLRDMSRAMIGVRFGAR
jgi:hypothetical protein